MKPPISNITSISLLSLAAFFHLFCSGKGPAKETDIAALVPEDFETPGWTRDGPLQKFEGDDLYIYIDGGAEIYLEYGFERVAVQDFNSADGISLSLEIFEMTAPESAYGMYTFKMSGKGKALDLGGGAELESYYLNFWEGRYLVTVTGFGENDRTVEGLVGLANAVAAKIQSSGEIPALAKALHVMGYESGRIRYIKGFLGLSSVYSFDTARGLDFKAGARGISDEGNILLVLDYDSTRAAREAFTTLREHVGGSARFKGLRTPDPDLAVAIDDKGRPLVFAPRGSSVLWAIGSEPEKARGLFDLVSGILAGIRNPPLREKPSSGDPPDRGRNRSR